jgi:hypothetical protein
MAGGGVTPEELGARHAKWYEHSDDLLQGTLLQSVRVFEESADSTEDDLSVKTEIVDLIVLTQSCDIGKDSQPHLLTAEVQPYSQMLEDRAGTDSTSAGYRKYLVRNTATSDMLLPPCEALSIADYQIVNFREVHTVLHKRVQRAEGYICLASPFREHLSQMFASFLMRVGLPTPPLREFEKYKP